MPNIKAAEKWAEQSDKRSERNKSAKSRLKTLFKSAVESAGADSAAQVESAYDKAAGKGIIHRNKAARKKGRLAKALTRSSAAPPKSAKGRGARKK